MEKFKNNERIEMDWTNQDGNAFAIMGTFRRNARRAGWSRVDIDLVIKEAMARDYDHLLQTLMKYTKD